MVLARGITERFEWVRRVESRLPGNLAGWWKHACAGFMISALISISQAG